MSPAQIYLYIKRNYNPLTYRHKPPIMKMQDWR